MSTQSTRSPRRLSVAMIVRDEQEVLADTLASVQGIADEVQVLDTGSLDRTPSLAAEWGAVVSAARWAEDFAAARNLLFGQLRGDWVLWLDAGERLDPDSSRALRAFVDDEADPASVYFVMVEIPGERHGHAEQAARLRLMPNRRGLRFEGRLCESVRPSALAAGLRLVRAPGRILCHRRRNDPRRKADKAVRDLRLIDAHVREGASMTPRLWLALGEAYSNLNQPVLAEQAFVHAIRAAANGSTEMLEGYYGLLTVLGADQTQRQRQLLAATEALEVYPFDAQLLCALGGYLQAQGRLDLAERSFRTAVQYGQIDLETWHLARIAEVAAACLSLTLRLQDKNQEAAGVLEEALIGSPSSRWLRRQLLDLCIKLGRDDDAIRLAGALWPDPPQRAWMGDVVRGACQAARQQWGLALALLQGAYLAGCREPIALRWLAVALLSNGEVEAARPILHQWHQAEPHHREVQIYLDALQKRDQGAEARGVSSATGPQQPRYVRFDVASPVRHPSPVSSSGVPQELWPRGSGGM